MSLISDLWSRLVTAIEGEATTVENTLTAIEQKLLPGLGALVKQIETTIGEQGLAILEEGAAAIGGAIVSGGDVSTAISDLIKKVVPEIVEDLKHDATNAAHGAIALFIAALAPTIAASPVIPPETVDAPAAPAAEGTPPATV